MSHIIHINVTILSALIFFTACGSSSNVILSEEPRSVEFADNNAATYTINNEQSTLTWYGGQFGFIDYEGTIQIQEGVVYMENSMITGGEITLDMTSLKNTNLSTAKARLDNEDTLKSEYFYDVEHFPTVTFSITGTEKTENNTLITGNLRIKDVVRSVTFPIEITEIENGYRASARLQIDRTEWNLHFTGGAAFSGISDSSIDKDIAMSMELLALPKD
jgi:polyisoprenoid-binding protein YceI